MDAAPKVLLGVIVVGAAAIAIFVATQVGRHQAGSTDSPPLTSKMESDVGRKTGDIVGDDPTKEPAVANEGAIDYAAKFRDAKDLWAFLEEIVPLAKSGFPSAQYHVYAALSECKAIDELYFKTGGSSANRLTLDEGMQRAVKTGGLDFEDVKIMYGRCQRILESSQHPFGDADSWLQSAAKSRSAIAQAQLAMSKAMESRSALSPEARLSAGEESRALLLASLRAKDPAAMVVAGDAALALGGFDDAARAKHEWVWLLAACQRNLDCSSNSAWYRFHCRFDSACQPFETGVVDVVRRLTGSRFDELEQRATALNSTIDHDRLEEVPF